ncbi:MAG: hypothetical protein PHN80_04860 [Hespellia sp.]|nr:hypothetical protein [Hespellia sp.]
MDDKTKNLQKKKKSRIAVTLGTTMAIAMMAIPTAAFAAEKPTTTVASAQEKNKDSEKDAASEAAEAKELQAKASITETEAIAAMKKSLGLSDTLEVISDGLGDENGTIVYQLHYTDLSGIDVDVMVDAVNGAVTAESADNIESEN